MRNLAVIVGFKSIFKIFSEAYVIMMGRILRFQDVHIIELHPPSLK